MWNWLKYFQPNHILKPLSWQWYLKYTTFKLKIPLMEGKESKILSMIIHTVGLYWPKWQPPTFSWYSCNCKALSRSSSLLSMSWWFRCVCCTGLVYRYRYLSCVKLIERERVWVWGGMITSRPAHMRQNGSHLHPHDKDRSVILYTKSVIICTVILLIL